MCVRDCGRCAVQYTVRFIYLLAITLVFLPGICAMYWFCPTPRNASLRSPRTPLFSQVAWLSERRLAPCLFGVVAYTPTALTLCILSLHVEGACVIALGSPWGIVLHAVGVVATMYATDAAFETEEFLVLRMMHILGGSFKSPDVSSLLAWHMPLVNFDTMCGYSALWPCGRGTGDEEFWRVTARPAWYVDSALLRTAIRALLDLVQFVDNPSVRDGAERRLRECLALQPRELLAMDVRVRLALDAPLAAARGAPYHDHTNTTVAASVYARPPHGAPRSAATGADAPAMRSAPTSPIPNAATSSSSGTQRRAPAAEPDAIPSAPGTRVAWGAAAVAPSPSSAPDQCSICLQALRAEPTAAAVPCGHVFHAQCLDRWLRIKAQCPLCCTTCSVTRPSASSAWQEV